MPMGVIRGSRNMGAIGISLGHRERPPWEKGGEWQVTLGRSSSQT